MTNYKLLNNELKQNYKEQITSYAQAIGGKNYFLQLIEAIRATNPHPLMSKDYSFRFAHGIVKWKKVIFKEKVILLIKLLKDREEDGNLIPKKGDKGYKTIMNLLRTMGPMEFQISPKNSKNGGGFILHPFDIIDKNTLRLNFMFEVLFFLPIYVVKQVFKGPKNKTSYSTKSL